MNNKNLYILILYIFVSIFDAFAAESEIRIPEYDLITQQITIYEKYNNLIPLAIKDLKNCASSSDGQKTSLSNNVLNYGLNLEDSGYNNFNECTVYNEKYWKAYFTLTQKDITVMLIRLFVLMREGYLKRAEMLLLYCYYDKNKEWERDNIILKSVTEDINTIKSNCNSIIEEGIGQWDSGNRSQALDLYKKALQIYPKSPWALYEISLTKLMSEIDDENEMMINNNTDLTDYYSVIRKFDPFYTYAYQGTMTPELKKNAKAMFEIVEPCYNELWKGINVIENMEKIGDGYYEMGEYEFAIYSYKYVLYHTYDDGFRDDIIKRIDLCFNGLGKGDLSTFLSDLLLDIEERINLKSN